MYAVDGPIAAAASQVQKAMQHHDDKRARRIKAFRDELPPPFNKYTNIDPGLAISVPVNDPKPAAILRELGAIRLLHKVREALHEAHWWFGEDGFISWVIAVRQLPAGHLEVFTDSAHHHDVLVEHSAWQTVFLEKLVEESCTYGVSVVGLPAASVRKFPQDDVRKQRLVQQLFDWNRSRIRSLQGTQGVLSIEIRRTNRGNAIVVVNLAQPAIANEFISTGIQWDGTTYSGRKYIKEWSMLQCEDCLGFGHQSVSCTEGVRCNNCGQHHHSHICKSDSSKCLHCGGPHKAIEKSCPQRENEARRLRDLASSQGKWFTNTH